MVDSGNMTGPNMDTYYSSVISICSMCTVTPPSQLKNNETLTGGISNTYMTTRTTDNIVFNAGTEFAHFGHVGPLILIKTSLYGLNISGTRFNYRLSDAPTDLGFIPYMGGWDICMRIEGYYYNYVA